MNGNENLVNVGSASSKLGQATLLHKGTHQLGRLFEAESDVHIAPVKWINHMQEYWYDWKFTLKLICCGHRAAMAHDIMMLTR